MSPLAVFPPIFVHSRSLVFFCLCSFIFHQFFLSILSSLDIFLFVSLYTYICSFCLWLRVLFCLCKLSCLDFVFLSNLCNSLWLMFCLLLVDTSLKTENLLSFFFSTLDFFLVLLMFPFCLRSSVILLLLSISRDPLYLFSRLVHLLQFILLFFLV
jgi:hypothetical protein